MRGVGYRGVSLGCVIGAIVLMLAPNAAQAQFFPFFQQQPQQQPAPEGTDQ